MTSAPREIFVFGSNEAGRHGKGAALHARNHHRAQYGVGFGPTGDAWAIPTKDAKLRTLPLDRIADYVRQFLSYAEEHPELSFKVTAIGTGYAGYGHKDIAPMFAHAPANCRLPDEWRPWRQAAELPTPPMPRVLNKKTSGLPQGAVYIGRPSKWGNPFVIGKHGTRPEVVAKYRAYLLGNAALMAALPELCGKDLVCWCAPEACHGDVLVELANNADRKAETAPHRPSNDTALSRHRIRTLDGK